MYNVMIISHATADTYRPSISTITHCMIRELNNNAHLVSRDTRDT